MALLEFCWYTAVSKVCTLEVTYYPFDSHVVIMYPRNKVVNHAMPRYPKASHNTPDIATCEVYAEIRQASPCEDWLVYLTTIFLIKTIYRRMTASCVNDELERIWKNSVVD
jgi:hypothetical protein